MSVRKLATVLRELSGRGDIFLSPEFGINFQREVHCYFFETAKLPYNTCNVMYE